MHSLTSSFKLFHIILAPLNGSRRFLAGVFAFVLLISTATAGQELTGARVPAEEAVRVRVVNSEQQYSDSNVAPVTDPATIMRNAKIIFIRKKTIYIEAPELENELLKRREFQRWGLSITRNEMDADLIIEVSHKIFTRFVYTVLDPRTNTVVATGKLSSLGGTLSTKIAKRFIENMQRVRP
jgi:hypothetical protein